MSVTPLYDHAKDAQGVYKMHVRTEADQDGFFFGHLSLDGLAIPSSHTGSQDRDVVIQRLREYADWHKTHDPSTETIPL